MSYTVKFQQGTTATRRGEFLPVKEVKPLKKLSEARKQFNVWVQLSLEAASPTYISLHDDLDRVTLAEFHIKATTNLYDKPAPPLPKTRSKFGVGSRDKAPEAEPRITKRKNRLV